MKVNPTSVLSPDYAKDNHKAPFAGPWDFLETAVTPYHAVAVMKDELQIAKFIELREDEDWSTRLKRNGKYFISRNKSSLIAFYVGGLFSLEDSAFSIISSHVDTICFKLKPHSLLPSSRDGGLLRVGVTPYSGGGIAQEWDAKFSTWWNRELGLGGRVMVRDEKGRVEQRLWTSDGPVAMITHSGCENNKGPFNYETQMVPIVGLLQIPLPQETVATTPLSSHHSTRLLQYIAFSLNIDPTDITDFDLQLYSTEPRAFLGLSEYPSFITAPRMESNICCFMAHAALHDASSTMWYPENCKDIMCAFLSDNEEVGSSLRQGARSTFLEVVLKRVGEVFCVQDQKVQEGAANIHNTLATLFARSLLISANAVNGINPSFIHSEIYDEELKMIPTYNKGIAVMFDGSGGTTSDCWGAEVAKRLAEVLGLQVQLHQSRSDTGGSGRIGPMLSQRLGVKSIEIGIPIMSLDSIRGVACITDAMTLGRFLVVCLTRWETLRGDFEEWDM